MARYLVMHTPHEQSNDASSSPSQMHGLAKAHGSEGDRPQWIASWSPDVTDERIFTLWEAFDSTEVLNAMARFRFLDHLDAHPIRVQEWGPTDILDAENHARIGENQDNGGH